jgi:hypothetical protein
MQTHAVDDTIEFFKALGLRLIFRNEDFGVLELRGGTQLIVAKRAKPIRKGTAAPFYIMVDVIEKIQKNMRKRTSSCRKYPPGQSIRRSLSAHHPATR